MNLFIARYIKNMNLGSISTVLKDDSWDMLYLSKMKLELGKNKLL